MTESNPLNIDRTELAHPLEVILLFDRPRYLTGFVRLLGALEDSEQVIGFDRRQMVRSQKSRQSKRLKQLHKRRVRICPFAKHLLDVFEQVEFLKFDPQVVTPYTRKACRS